MNLSFKKRKKIIISAKNDWMIKTEGKINVDKYKIKYVKKFKTKDLITSKAILPLFERDQLILENKFPRYFKKKCFTPGKDIINICEDKAVFNDFMVENGFKNLTPKSNKNLDIPFVLKKRKDEFGQNTFIIDSESLLKQHFNKLQSNEFIKQELISGKNEFTTHFIFKNGKLIYDFTLKFEFKKDKYVKGVQSPPFKTANIKPHKTEFKNEIIAVLSKMNYEGVGCINFKLVDNVPKFFEINPRVGGSLPLDVNNFIDIYLKNLN